MRYPPAVPSIATVSPRLVALIAIVLGAGCARGGYEELAILLSVDPLSLRFTATAGETLPAQPVALSSGSGSPFTWSAVPDDAWVLIADAQGTGPDTLWISVRTGDLEPGTHQSTVSISVEDVEGTTESVSVAVELTLTNPGWTSLRGPSGGFVRRLAMHPVDPDRVLAGDSSGRLFVSSDGGQTFGPAVADLSSNGIVGIVLSEGDVGYCATSDTGVFETTDRGLTWAATSLQDLPLNSLAMDPASPDVVLAHGNDLWHSADGGQSWSVVPMATNTTFVTADANAAGTFVVGDDAGNLYRGDGATFTALPTGTDFRIESFASLPSGRWLITHFPRADSANYAAVSVSDDSGATWTEAGEGLTWPYLHHIHFYVATGDGDVWVTSSQGAALSTDGGEVFTIVSLAFDPAAERAAEIGPALPHAGGVLLPSNGEGVLHGGLDVTSTGLERSAIYGSRVISLAYQESADLLVVPTDAYQLFTHDATDGFAGIWHSGLAEGYGSVLVDPRNPFVIHVTHWSWRYGVQVTFDGGTTWEETLDVMPGSLRRAPDAPDVLWLAAYNPSDLYRSVDNGLVWNVVADGTSGRLVAISSEIALLHDSSTVQRVTAAGGVGETLFSGAGTLAHFSRSPDGSVWLAADYLYRSTDDGQTFVPTTLIVPEVRGVAVAPSDPDRVFVGTSTGMVQSSDGGQTWEDAGAPFGVSIMLMTPGGEIFVAGLGGGMYAYVP